MLDWQTIVVILIIAGAVFYTGARAWKRINAFRLSKSGSSCETGCGKCASESAPQQPPTKRTVLVELTRHHRN